MVMRRARGQGGGDLLAAAELDSVDMSELDEDMLAHGYSADDRSVLTPVVLWMMAP